MRVRLPKPVIKTRETAFPHRPRNPVLVPNFQFAHIEEGLHQFRLCPFSLSLVQTDRSLGRSGLSSASSVSECAHVSNTLPEYHRCAIFKSFRVGDLTHALSLVPEPTCCAQSVRKYKNAMLSARNNATVRRWVSQCVLSWVSSSRASKQASP